MPLSQQVQEDLHRSMRRGDKTRTSTLRLLRAALRNREIAKGGSLEEVEALEVVMQAVKQRREAIAMAREYHRDDIAQREASELAVLEDYLPHQLNHDELQRRIESVVRALGADSPRDVGRVMKVLMAELRGQADGQTISRLVRERLA